MQELNITGFDQAGVITDINEYLLTPAAFSEAYNVRFSNGSIESAKGYTLYEPSVITSESPWKYSQGIADKMYLLSDDKLRVMTDNNVEEVAYLPAFDLEKETYINPLSNLPVFVNNGVPYGLKDDGAGKNIMFKLDGWGDNMKCRSVVSYKGYLFAFGVQVDGIRYEDTIFWSDVAAPDTYPKDWGFTLSGGNVNLGSPVKGSLGGYNQLGSIGGSIVAASVFSDSLFLFTESEIFSVTEIGGTFLFSFKRVLVGKGAVSPSSVIALENGLVVIGSNELYLFNGGSTQTLSNGRIGNYISRKVLTGTQIKMVRDFNEKHLYIFFKQTSRRFSRNVSDVFDDALVYDWVSNTFSFRDSSYCQFQDITEFRADSLFDGYNKKWSEYETTKWDEFQSAWQSELKYGTGLLACRKDQLLILNNGYSIVEFDKTMSPVPWSFRRTFYTATLGYPEDAIARMHALQFKGSTYTNLRFVINDSISVMKPSKKGFVRVTGKSFKVEVFGTGYMSLPVITIVHSLVGVR